MAPLTLCRATLEHVPTPLMAKYYAQMASAARIAVQAPQRGQCPNVLYTGLQRLYRLPNDDNLVIFSSYHCIRQVADWDELVSTPFADGVNALCWRRELPGDFEEVVRQLRAGPGITTLEDSQLLNLPLSPAGLAAVEVLLNDQDMLRKLDLDPVLDCINGYAPCHDPGPLRTDVCSFHVDSAPTEVDTYLCTYFGASSEGLRHDQACRWVDVPETRARLLESYGGPDDEGFLDYLAENCFDLHYRPDPGATPFSFGVGNLWRIAIRYPGCPVPACIHRAPTPVPGDLPRLLLLS
jgi:hypothetical protein